MASPTRSSKAHDWMVPYYRSVASLITFGMSPREIMLAQFARGVDPSSRRPPDARPLRHRRAAHPVRLVAGRHAAAARHGHRLGGQAAQDRPGDDHLHRRGLVQPGRLPRGPQLRRSTSTCRSSTSSRTTATRSACPCRSSRRCADIAIRGAGYNMPGVIVDGADVLECYRAGKEAIDRARKGDGPTLIEAKVTRLTAHSSDDQQSKYRSAEELSRAEGPRPAAALPRSAARRRTARRRDRRGDHGRGTQSRRGRDRLGRGPGRSRSGYRPAARLRRRAAGAHGRSPVERRPLHGRWRAVGRAGR